MGRLLLLCATALIFVPSCHRASASSGAPPDHMTELDAARFREAKAVLSEANTKITLIQQQAAPEAQRLNDLCERYKIPPADVFKGGVQVSEDGTIQRQAVAPPAAPPPAPTGGASHDPRR